MQRQGQQTPRIALPRRGRVDLQDDDGGRRGKVLFVNTFAVGSLRSWMVVTHY